MREVGMLVVVVAGIVIIGCGKQETLVERRQREAVDLCYRAADCLKAKNSADAESLFRKALELDPFCDKARNGLAAMADGEEAPTGYKQVNHDDLHPNSNATKESVPSTALRFNGEKILVNGYMQPRRQQANIKEFILCPSAGDCPFCIPNPRPTEKVRVLLQGDLRTNYTTRKIRIGGRFRVDPNDPSGMPYSIEADYIH